MVSDLRYCMAAKVARCLGFLPQQDRASLKGPHKKILDKKPNKEVMPMVLDQGEACNSSGQECIGQFSWMSMWDWHVVLMNGVRKAHRWHVGDGKNPRASRTWSKPTKRQRLTCEVKIAGYSHMSELPRFIIMKRKSG